MTGEQWRAIPGHAGYEVSDQGQVRSVTRTVVRTGGSTAVYRGKVLRQKRNPQTGYMQVTLSDGGRQTTHRVNILVLQAFVGPRPVGQVCRHLNDVGYDNRLKNLQWGTQSANMRDLAVNGLHANANRTHCPQGHPYDAANTYRTPSGKGGRQCATCHRERARRAEERRSTCRNGHEYPPDVQVRISDRAKRRYCPTCVANRKPRTNKERAA
ncbi:NUMOD4 domain-containing protein [Williamsia deligens]|uniref:NUMOD4 domain-containing protein n=1 Tax=Williamsia deligens TaxID=321325 RepID=A0ABW3GC17_9NOCA|nr:NUMOD4 domain-containing protein [Williamsia deligens]MCP2196311.1 NUMOD4 motif-containing protein [Williamsia deligens]